jgi:hypothetical protein
VVFGALVFKLLVWCGTEGYVSVLWVVRYGVELKVMCPVCRLLQPANWTRNLQVHIIPTTWKPKHQIPQAAATCIMLSSSWCWE